MTTKEIIRRLNSVQLSIYVHPDRKPDSEFADQVDSLTDIIAEIGQKLAVVDMLEELASEEVPVFNKPNRSSGFKKRREDALAELRRVQGKS